MKKFLEFMKGLSLAFVFSRLEKWASAIPMVEMQVFAIKRINDLRKLETIFTDNDFDNISQLKAMYIAEREFFVDDSLVLAAAIVREHVEDEHLAELVAATLIDLANKDLFRRRDNLVQNPFTAPSIAKTSLKGKRRTMTIVGHDEPAQAGEVKMVQPPTEPVETHEQARLRAGDEAQVVVLAQVAERERAEIERKLSGVQVVPTESLAADFLAQQAANTEPEIPFPDAEETQDMKDGAAILEAVKVKKNK